MSAVIQSPQPLLRNMQLDDLDSICEIESRCYPYPWSKRIFADCIKVGYSCWVMKLDGQIVGYGILAAAAGEAHILNVCVDRDYQNQGLGHVMADRLINMARWFHCDKIFLEVRPSNTPAVCLYQRLGFETVGSRPGYYPAAYGREDALIMALSLDYSGKGT